MFRVDNNPVNTTQPIATTPATPPPSVPTNTPLASPTTGFSKKEAISFGWHTTTSHIGIVLLLGLFYIAFFAIDSYINKFLGTLINQPILLFIIGLINSYIISPLFSIIVLSALIKLTDGQKIVPSELIAKCKVLPQFVFTTILISLIILGGFIMLIIPGLIWSFDFIFGTFFVVDQNLGTVESLKRSLVATKGMKGNLTLLYLLFLGIAILGLLALGIGLVLAAPTIAIAFTFVYRKLQSQTASTDISTVKLFTIPKIIALILGILAICIVLVFQFMPQLYLTPLAHILYSKEKTPLAYIVPTSRQLLKPQVNLSDYPSFSYIGVNFQSPWKNVVDKHSDGEINIVKFDQNRSISLVAAPSLITGYQATNPNDANKLKAVMGAENIQSSYNFYSAILNTTPDQITYSTPAGQAYGKFILLTLKKLKVTESNKQDNNVYSFNTTNIRGYQQRTPEVSKISMIDFFDNQDHGYSMIIAAPDLTQNDVDFILSTIKTSNNNSENPSFSPDLGSTKQSYESGQYSQTIILANKALTEATTDEEKAYCHYWIGLSYFKQNLLTQSETEETLATQLSPTYAAPYTTLSAIDLSKNNYQQALTDAQKSAQLDPSYGWAYNDQGLAYIGLHQQDQAIAMFKKAVAIDPTNQVFQDDLSAAEK